MQNLFALLVHLLISSLSLTRAANVDTLVAKANIYYQRPLSIAGAVDVPLSAVTALPSTTSVKLIVHGFTGSRTHISIRPLVESYLAHGYENVLVADWQDAAAQDYHSSRQAVSVVALYLAGLLEDFLIKWEIEYAAVHLIGHSLGAHIVGGMGRFFNGTLGRITGLDPALPFFSPLSDDSLQADAAQFVDVIHTDYPFFGDITPRGDVDFYPRFGRTPQKGCPEIDAFAATRLILEAYSCSHNRAVTLYAESVAEPLKFPALKCSWNGIRLRSVAACLREFSNHTSAVDALLTVQTGGIVGEALVYMGEAVSRNATGFYYLS